MLCTTLFFLFISITGGTTSGKDTRVRTCQLLHREAVRQDVDPAVAVSVAWLESRWVSRAHNRKSGARGPLQILPKYWCPDARGRWRATGSHTATCDFTRWGVHALRYYLNKHEDERRAFAEFGYTSTRSNYVKLATELTRRARAEVAKNQSTP